MALFCILVKLYKMPCKPVFRVLQPFLFPNLYIERMCYLTRLILESGGNHESPWQRSPDCVRIFSTVLMQGKRPMNDDLNEIGSNIHVDNLGVNKLLRRQQGLRKAHRLLWIYRAKFPHHLDWYAFGGEIEHRLLKTRVPCSCPMCGNPRRYRDQRTLQEIVSDNDLRLDSAIFS